MACACEGGSGAQGFWMKAALWAIAWGAAYAVWPSVTQWVVFDVLTLDATTRAGRAIEFFLYDVGKIYLLLIAMMYVIGWLRAGWRLEKLRDWLSGKSRGLGYVLASGLGAVTPFCSCSSVPLFVGFSHAGIPFGVSMAFLITSPMINEVAVVMLWEMLGYKLALTYVAIGLTVGIIGGMVFDALKSERHLQPFVLAAMQLRPGAMPQGASNEAGLCANERHRVAWADTKALFKKIWLWVIAGVGVGAAIHGYVPDDWFVEHLADQSWWSVPVAVGAGIPLYTNVTGIVPVMQSLLVKGLPVGTTLALTMSTVAVSLPECIMLKNVMQTRLLVQFVVYLLIVFTLVGWLLNAVGPQLLS